MAAVSELRQQMVRVLVYSVLFLNYFGQSAGSEKVPTSGCVCPGDTLSYECTVMGYGITIWTGSAFNCPSIIILSRIFDIETGTCNNGTIVARILSAEGNNYTSQLNITVTPDTAGKTTECIYDNGTYEILIFTSIIPTITGALLPPNTLGINNAAIISLRQLTFSWSPVAPDCPTVHYNIQASNCGSCPTTTNHTNVTCSNVPADINECNFAIQTVVCGNIMGNFSNPIGMNTHTFYPRDTNTAYIVSISSLATFSVVSISALLVVIVIVLMRSRIKIKAALDSQATNRAESSTQMESMYEEPIPSVSAINTRDNIAYGHTKTTTT